MGGERGVKGPSVHAFSLLATHTAAFVCMAMGTRENNLRYTPAADAFHVRSHLTKSICCL